MPCFWSLLSAVALASVGVPLVAFAHSALFGGLDARIPFFDDPIFFFLTLLPLIAPGRGLKKRGKEPEKEVERDRERLTGRLKLLAVLEECQLLARPGSRCVRVSCSPSRPPPSLLCSPLFSPFLVRALVCGSAPRRSAPRNDTPGSERTGAPRTATGSAYGPSHKGEAGGCSQDEGPRIMELRRLRR